MLLYWIWFAELPNIQLWQKHILLQHFHDPRSLYQAHREAFKIISDISESMVNALQNKDLQKARKILQRCEEKNIHILTLNDSSYPYRLKNIREAPLVLYYKGYLPNIDDVPAIAVVGTRKASSYGMSVARRMGAQIAACGGMVISGGAFGNDTMALRGALEYKTPVVAVLASGVDVVYPKSNASLFEQIATSGCLISEYPPGTRPYGWHFPIRNRILSGLCNGVLVVEAPEGSGALITARLALDQGRDVFVVPGNIDVPSCAGSNALLQGCASAVFSGWDILQEYIYLYPGKIQKISVPDSSLREEVPQQVAETVETPEKSPRVFQKAEKLPIDKEEKSSYIVLSNDLPKLSREEQAVLSCLKDTPRPVDDIIAEAGLSTQKVLSVLTMLGIKGLVINHPGGQVSLK